MSNTYIQIGTYNDHSQDHSKHVTVNVPAGTDVSSIVRSIFAEDVAPVDDSSFASDNLSDISNSIIFTKKAKLEHKEPYIIQALQKSVLGRKDKTRAFVQELHDWQNQAYVDAHYNARVMYDELEKLMPISFGYDVFRRLYNSSRN
ncbi:MAG: hypothetical protein IKM83_01005 [Paludibacteraceae bacterium]|nr:hypothetical protein [Paludibacteraceae bacterium]